jgi:hypothetical protein
VVRFTAFEVRIEPKLPGEHLELFRMVEFAAVSTVVQLAGSPACGSHHAPRLRDGHAVVRHGADPRGGLRADYVEPRMTCRRFAAFWQIARARALRPV